VERCREKGDNHLSEIDLFTFGLIVGIDKETISPHDSVGKGLIPSINHFLKSLAKQDD
jgi:hypothetical protein